jgi:methyl-accepting chemotaxis protein
MRFAPGPPHWNLPMPTRLDHLSIRTKVLSAFALVLVSCFGLGGFAALRLNQVSAAAEDVAGNWLPSAAVLGSLSMDFERLRTSQVLSAAGEVSSAAEQLTGEVKGFLSQVRAA